MNTIEYKDLTPKQATKDIKFCMKEQPTTPFIGDYSFYNNRRQLYLNTNDQIHLITPDVVTENSKILTVASSGDYLLESAFNGASEIVSFDINKLQYYISCLKVWAIQTLSYEEYISFFHSPCSFDYMSPELIETIISQFKDEPAHIFWDVFKEHRAKEIKAAKSPKYRYSDEYGQNFFNEWKNKVSNINPNPGNDKEAFIQYRACAIDGPLKQPRKFNALNLLSYRATGSHLCSFSSNKTNYNLTRDNLSHTNISFLPSDLLKLQSALAYDPEPFDGAILSNIPSYLLPTYITKGIDELFPLLNEDGMISYYYPHMRKSWFDEYLSEKEVPVEDEYTCQGEGRKIKYHSALCSYEQLIKSGFDISLEELPNSYNAGIKETVNTDVKCLVKKY